MKPVPGRTRLARRQYQSRRKPRVFLRLLVLLASFGVALFLARTRLALEILEAIDGGETVPLGSFVSGLFFVSVFTVVPAGVVLVELSQTASPLLVAVFGAFGAVVGDFLIFYLVENSADGIGRLTWSSVRRRKLWRRLTHSRSHRWLMPVLGAVIVASPFPDEVGLALMGLSHLHVTTFLVLSFGLNFLGILMVTVAGG